ncbi:MAG: Hpt domain-containing protein, partial [Gammaproteobacteria bacterium]
STGFEDLGAVAATPAAEIEAGKPAPAAEPQQASASKAAGTRAVDPSLVDTFESDAEIVEIFVEEVDEVLGAIDEWLPIWRDDLKHEDALTEVRRSFHTLKGSGRIVGANVIGELAWSVENMLNRLIDGTVEPTQQFVAVVDQARQLAPELKEAFELKRTPDMGRVGAVMEQADVLASGGTLDEASSVAAPEAEDSALQIFLAEAALHLKALRDAVTPEGVQLTEASVRALHTLAGSAGMAEFSVIEELARPTYELASALRGASDRTVDGEAADYFRRAIQALGEALRAVVAGAEPEDPVQLIAEADHLIVAATEQAAAGESPSRVALMELDGLSQVMGADEFLDNWKNGAMDLAYGETLVEALDDIGDAASENDAQPIADLARAFSAALVRLADGRLDDGAYRTLAEGHGRLLDLFDALAAEQSFDGVEDVVAALDTLDAGLEAEEEQPRVPDERGATKDNIVAFPA